MLTKQTLEIRWFNPGELPANIQQWFYQDCLGTPEQSQNSPEEREDYYLYLPNCQILSFKWREKNIEIKFRVDKLVNSQNTDIPTGQGNIERWIKLQYDRDSLKDILNTEQYQQQTWLKVNKKRWQRFYKEVEFELGYLEIKSNLWWTMAAEMEENENNTQQHFQQIISEFSQGYPASNLSAKQSYAYPTWLLESFHQ